MSRPRGLLCGVEYGLARKCVSCGEGRARAGAGRLSPAKRAAAAAGDGDGGARRRSGVATGTMSCCEAVRCAAQHSGIVAVYGNVATAGAIGGLRA